MHYNYPQSTYLVRMASLYFTYIYVHPAKILNFKSARCAVLKCNKITSQLIFFIYIDPTREHYIFFKTYIFLQNYKYILPFHLSCTDTFSGNTNMKQHLSTENFMHIVYKEHVLYKRNMSLDNVADNDVPRENSNYHHFVYM